MKLLRISGDLTLPLDAVTQTFGILAVRGAGKSNTAAVMAEQMHAAGLPFVVVDPVGSWWGLRAAGQGPGLSIPVFGGRHGDVPLEKAGGQLIADLVVDDRLSCVLDISEFSEGDKTRFLIDFAERLYRRNTDPLHLFLEEADDYAPQRPFREQARLLRAWENVVRRGRARGLGITLITQRSASLNKSVLTQVETLIVLRTTSPQDRKAIQGWVDYHGQSRELVDSLPSLESGEAWIWSPSYLRLCKRVRINRRETFDSAATPKDVKGKRPPATLADVDLSAIGKRMAETIEKAKLEDPRELRKLLAERDRRIAELERAKPPEPKVERVEVPVLKPVDLLEVAKLCAAAQSLSERVDALHGRLVPYPSTIPPVQRTTLAPAARQPVAARALPSPVRRAAPPSANGHDALGAGERRILAAIAQHKTGCTREQLTVLTGYKRSSRDTYLQRLRAAGLVEHQGDRIVETMAGMHALGPDFERLPTGDALREHWLERLPQGERAILAVVVKAYPRAVSRDALSEATGYQRSSRDTYLQRLGSRRLVESVGRGEVKASDELFS